MSVCDLPIDSYLPFDVSDLYRQHWHAAQHNDDLADKLRPGDKTEPVFFCGGVME